MKKIVRLLKSLFIIFSISSSYAINKENLKRLAQYVPVVARVHGGTHPELHDCDARTPGPGG